MDSVEVEDHGRRHELVAVAHVHLQAIQHVLGVKTLANQVLSAFGLELLHDGVETVIVVVQGTGGRVVHDDVRTPLMDVQLLHVARPQGGEHRCERRCEDPLDAGIVRHAARVQRSVAAVGKHGELLGQVAAHAQLLGHPDGHLLVDAAFDLFGNLDDVHVQLVTQRLLDREDGPFRVELDDPVGVVVRVQVAQQKIGGGDRGPQSAPVVAGRGGLRATVTDADLLLGYLDPDNYANGVIKLNPKRSVFAIEETLCDELDMDVIQVAKEIKRGVDEQMAIGMAKELRVRGYLPEEFTMLAYGGNGPLHACGMADYAGIKRVLAPPFASVFYALGAGNMKQLHIHERGTHVVMYNATTRGLYDDYDAFNAVVEELEAEGREDLVRQGFDPQDVLYRLETVSYT